MDTMQQPALPFPSAHDEHHVVACLQKKTGKTISLVVTDNATSMISFRKKGASVTLRLHRLFLGADERIFDEIAGFIKNRSCPMNHTRIFISSNRHHLKSAAPRRITINTRGRQYDLTPIFDGLNRRYFNGAVSSAITWSRRGARRFPARRTLGTYLEDRNLIRINPVLDSRRVPLFYIEFIVYHEMLHAVMESEVKNGRRSIHAKEFRKREKLFEQYAQAALWERENR